MKTTICTEMTLYLPDLCEFFNLIVNENVLNWSPGGVQNVDIIRYNFWSLCFCCNSIGSNKKVIFRALNPGLIILVCHTVIQKKIASSRGLQKRTTLLARVERKRFQLVVSTFYAFSCKFQNISDSCRLVHKAEYSRDFTTGRNKSFVNKKKSSPGRIFRTSTTSSFAIR